MRTNSNKNVSKTFKGALVGGVAGACLGVTTLGVVAGISYANKEKIKKFVNKINL